MSSSIILHTLNPLNLTYKKMFIYYFLAKNTIDETIYKILNKKKDNQQNLIDNDIISELLK